VDSEAQKGTRVTLVLPAVQRPVAVDARPAR
jgi:hypothetical protein